MSNLQIVTTPTMDVLCELAQACTSRMLVGSPYVNNGLFKFADMVPDEVSKTLVTRTDLYDFAHGSSSLETLCTLAERGVVIRSLRRLHAKMYIFDDAAALVTSANATTSGMWRNLECGLITDDVEVVAQLSKALLAGLGADDRPRIMFKNQLAALRAPVEAIRTSLPEPKEPRSKDDLSTYDSSVGIDGKESFLSGFSGWEKLVLERVLNMRSDIIRLDELHAACLPFVSVQYPKNQHVRPKIRQQLQRLIAHGLVRRESPGMFRRTIRIATR